MISYSQSTNIKLYFEVLILIQLSELFLNEVLVILNDIVKSVICQFRETENKIYQQQLMS